MLPEFVENTCLPFLLKTQNDDGGWGFKASLSSRAEPTSWAILALLESASMKADPSVSRGFQFLSNSQLADGSWPSSSELIEGSWVTSLACLALLSQRQFSGNVQRGLHWLTAEVPWEAKTLRRIVQSILPKRSEAKQNESKFGWSWTPGMASWVEPTAYALILLHRLPATMQTQGMQRRLQLGESMLLDRMCPGGGWNCGNPMVYGVPGDPQVSPTVWALLALKTHPERPEIQKSLQWLEGFLPSIQSPVSRALAEIAMDVFGKHESREEESLAAMLLKRDEATRSIPELAWSVLALTRSHKWLAPLPDGRGD